MIDEVLVLSNNELSFSRFNLRRERDFLEALELEACDSNVVLMMRTEEVQNTPSEVKDELR